MLCSSYGVICLAVSMVGGVMSSVSMVGCDVMLCLS